MATRSDRFYLDTKPKVWHAQGMSNALSQDPVDDEAAAELAALRVAVERSLANNRGVPHAEMRKWLIEVANGNFDNEPPESIDL